MMIKREYYYLIIGFLSSLSLMGAGLFFIGRTDVQSEEPVTVAVQQSQPVLPKKLRWSALEPKTVPVSKSLASIRDTGNATKIIETKDQVTEAVAPSTDQNNNALLNFDSFDPNGAVPQTIAEMEQYINDMANAIRDLFKDNQKLRDMVKKSLQDQEARGEPKGYRDHIMNRAFNGDERLPDNQLLDCLGQKQLEDERYSEANRARVEHNFQQVYENHELHRVIAENSHKVLIDAQQNLNNAVAS